MGGGEDIVAESSTAAELAVGGEDTRVDDVGVGVGTGRGVVDVLGRARSAVGDGAETPGGARLGSQSALGVDLLNDEVGEVHVVVGLDKGDLW